MILSVLKVFLCIFFFFLLVREYIDYEILLNVLKKKCVEVDCCEKWFDWKKVIYVDCFIFFFFVFKIKIFVYICSNRFNEVLIEFFWLYVIIVDIYICEICLLFLLIFCFFFWRVCECYIILLYFKNIVFY